MANVFRTVVVPAATQADAQAVFSHGSDISVPGGAGMCTSGLSATGVGPATWYVNSGWVDSTFAALFPYTRATFNPVTQLWQFILSGTGNPTAVANAATSGGYPITPAAVTALFASWDLSDQPVWTALARLGLQPIQGTP